MELFVAEARARELFDAFVKRGEIVAGKSESDLSQAMFALAKEMFDIDRYWHKRIVRAGANTLLPYRENPPDHVLADDDILFFDFGPVFDDWEADFGQTFVLGSDPNKLRLASDVASAWDEVAAHAVAHPQILASELYTYAGEVARRGGWELGHVHIGHIVGKFPHEKILGDEDEHHIRFDNHLPLRRPDVTGALYEWILEIHFVDKAAGYGAFQEALVRY